MEPMIKSKIPELMEKKGVRAVDLIANNISNQTAYRIARGEANFNLATLDLIMQILDTKDFNEVLEYVE